ncbi:MAG TPA: c-type cytochrome [Thermohalobaculum sp.]|nr:c-type cytochrome [Thermohalobaculum sp.]
MQLRIRVLIGIWLAVLALAPVPAPAAEPIVAYTIADGSRIDASLTGAAGNPDAGAALFFSAAPGGCAGCHGMPGTGGGGAADLAGLGARRTPGEIRLWIVAPEVIAPETGMPAFYAPGQRLEPDDPLYGGPALTAQQVEDLVAYLSALGR